MARIEARRAHADAQTRLIDTLRNQINTAQAAALSQQSQTGLAAELSKLELAAGTVPVTGPGLVLTVDDAPTQADPVAPDANPRTVTGPDQGKVIARDLQIIVNGLWDAGAEAISINGHRLTSRAAIRSAGAAILVDYRPLTRPYVITAIGDPGSLGVEFADNSGGSYLQSLKTNYQIRGDIQNRTSVVVPGSPHCPCRRPSPCESAVTSQTATGPTATSEGTTTRAPQTNSPPNDGDLTVIPALGLLVGLAVGLFLHPAVPLALQPYLPIAVIAALDAVFGGVRAVLDGIFNDKVFVVSFLSNVVVAAFIVFLGDQLGVGSQLSTGVVVVLGIRIFSNVASIRRHLFRA